MAESRISLLRSATAPDPHQDEGLHSFSFAIVPHRKRFLESGAFEESLRFINPVQTIKLGGDGVELLRSKAIYVEDGSGVILDAVKRGEDDERNGKRTIVLRMYESLGGRSSAVLRL